MTDGQNGVKVWKKGAVALVIFLIIILGLDNPDDSAWA